MSLEVLSFRAESYVHEIFFIPEVLEGRGDGGLVVVPPEAELVAHFGPVVGRVVLEIIFVAVPKKVKLLVHFEELKIDLQSAINP